MDINGTFGKKFGADEPQPAPEELAQNKKLIWECQADPSR